MLNLSGNEITPKAAQTIMELTKGIPTLEQVILGTNCFGHKFDELLDIGMEGYGYVDLGNER